MALALTYFAVVIVLPRRNRRAFEAAVAAAKALGSDVAATPLPAILTRSATRLAADIRDGTLTSVEVVEACIAQIERVNPLLNAVVATRFVEARQEAQQADAMVRAWRAAGMASDGLPPFCGVPCSVKECFAVAGMPHTAGLVSRRGVVAKEDAPVVQRYKAAGLIVLCVTNTSELCMWYESSNKLYGKTSNPYSVSHMVGGSSGGEAAIIAACAVPVGIGSDVGGSIRMPAYFNGVFGHKPSSFLVPNTGQHPNAEAQAIAYLCTGPMTRHVEDLWPLLRIMWGPSPGASVRPMDHFPLLARPSAVADVHTRQLHVWIASDLNADRPVGSTHISPDVTAAVQLAASTLGKAHGAQVHRFRFKEFADSTNMWSSLMALAEQPSFRDHLENNRPINICTELLRTLTGRGTFTVPALALALVEGIPPRCTPRMVARYARATEELKQKLNAMLGDNGVLIFPPHPTAAPVHHLALFRPFNFSYTALFNVLELPVTQVPTGLSPDGLPVGVQIVAAHGRDHLTLRVAADLSSALGVHHGLQPPPTARLAATQSPTTPAQKKQD